MQPGAHIICTPAPGEKNNKLKFNVAIMRVYGDCGGEGGRGEAVLMRGLSEGSRPTWTSPVQE